MNYRSILKNQLNQRKLINPRFSLRSLAQKIELSPSKLSEILNGRVALSSKRATIIADKLGLKGKEREIFVLSTLIEDDSKKEAAAKLKILVDEYNSERTAQRNAWYFGAVKATEEKKFDPSEVADALGLTSLQVENAQRFLKRIKRFHPDRKRLSFEATSVISRLQDELLSNAGDHHLEFIFLDESDATEMEQEIESVIRRFKMKAKKPALKDLRWIYFTQFRLTKRG